MSDHSVQLPFWEGFTITSFTEQQQSVLIRLEPSASTPRICGHCASAAPKIHDVCRRTVHDLPIVGRALVLSVATYRLRCGSCGRTAGQHISWLDPYSRVTRRLAAFVALWSERMPISHVCQLTGLHWSTVRQIHQQALQRKLAALPEAQPTRLVMDEFALFKGHRYATVVLDADSRQVLWVGEGRSREAIRPFFEWLGPMRCARIKAVAMDMNTAFDLEVQKHCPRARVVYDLFHVIAKYGREVIDRVRVDEANRLRQDRPQRKVIKRARWLLLRNRENVPLAQQGRLDELLAANQTLMTVYVMKAALKELWQPSSAWQWLRAWKDWLRMARESGIEPLRKFANKLQPYWRGIASRLRWSMHTGQLEGINNRIKVMKRMAYGFRDSAFFFLKIKAAFPGNP